MRRNKKKNLSFIIVLVLLCLGIGYAYLTTTLSINGVTDVDRNVWDVYFDNIEVTSGSVTGSQVIDEPEVGVDETSVSFHVNLKKPGDYYEFTVDAKNDGTLDAMIGSFSKKINGVEVIELPAYLFYTVRYEDDSAISKNQLLAAETVETYKVRIEYRNDINPNELPSTAQNLTISFGVEYVQADSTAYSIVRGYYYCTGDDYQGDGEELPSRECYKHYDDAIRYSGFPMFIRFKLIGNNIAEQYIGFVLDGKDYYIRNGGITFGGDPPKFQNDSIYYDSNKLVLDEAFGEENCEYYVSSTDEAYFCDLENIHARISHKPFQYVYSSWRECRSSGWVDGLVRSWCQDMD